MFNMIVFHVRYANTKGAVTLKSVYWLEMQSVEVAHAVIQELAL